MDDASDDYIPFQFDEPHLTLDPTCPTCHGKGVMEDDGRLLECTCLLRQRVLHYLTPTYGSEIPWHPSFQPEPYVGKDVFIRNVHRLSIYHFRTAAYAAVKSFLIRTDRRFSHRALTPYDLFRSMFNTKDAAGLAELTRTIKVLVLFLGGDDPPRATNYLHEIPWLIRKRRENGAVTWVLSALELDSNLFEGRYPGLRDPLQACIAERFMELPLDPPPAGKRP